MQPRLALVLAACAGLIAAFAAPATAAVPGDLDRSFGTQGSVALAPGGNNFQVLDATTDSQGRLLVAGSSGGDLAVARLLPDGTLDSSFDGDGLKVIESGPTSGGETARSISVDAVSGKILVFGDAAVSTGTTNQDLAVARLTTTGALDTSFDGPAGNGNGVFRLSFDPMETAGDVLAAGEGEAVLSAMVGGNQAGNSVRVVRLTDTGTLDTAFGSPNGYADVQYAAASGSFAEALALQGDGKVLVGGSINGTATFAVARFTAEGVLDATFAPSAAVPGVARPALPSGHISARAHDMRAVADGIVIAGEMRAGSPSFDTDPMVAKLTTTGAPDPAFGTSGFRKVPAGAAGDFSVFSSIHVLTDGSLLAGGTLGTTGNWDQILARIGADGTLDTAFAGAPDGLVRSNTAISDTGTAAPVGGGVAYLAGVGDGTKVAVTAVCAEVPPACPTPETPASLAVDPPSGSNENLPEVTGTIAAGAEVTSVEIYATADCTGTPLASGSEAAFTGPGIAVPVEDNTTTTFRAVAKGHNGSSPCSTDAVTYDEVTPASVVLEGTNPPSGSNENNPRVRGLASVADTISIYTDAECAGTPLATGSKAEFTGLGIQISVPDNSTTTLYAKSTGPGGDSGCVGGYEYREVTPPAGKPGGSVDPVTTAPAATKCKKTKKKKGAKKRKCKRPKPKRR